MNAIPKREQQEVASELAGIWKQENQESALLKLAAFKAKYQKRSPEAVRNSAPAEHVCLLIEHAERACHAAQSLRQPVLVSLEVHLNGQLLPLTG